MSPPRLTALLIACVFSSSLAHATEGVHGGYALSIYRDDDADVLFAGPADFEPPPGLAQVRERRTLNLRAGRNRIALSDIPRHVDGTAIDIRIDPGHVLSQRLDAEPLRGERILERSLGRQVVIEHYLGGEWHRIEGELLSAMLPLTVRRSDGSVSHVNDYSRLHVPDPPPALSALPQLHLVIDSVHDGEHRLQLGYPVAGLAWRTDYAVHLHPGRDCRLDFAGAAQLVNRSGHDFDTAHIRLLASEPGPDRLDAAGPEAGDDEAIGSSDPPGSLRLDEPVDLPDQGSLQITLVPNQPELACSREPLYIAQPLRLVRHRVPITEARYGHGGEHRIREHLSFELQPARHLPDGRVRVLRLQRGNGGLDLLGEQRFAAVPAGERVDLPLGELRELHGERTVRDFQLDRGSRSMAETIEVRIDNRGNQARTIRVREHLYRWRQWQIIDNSHEFRRRDDDTIDFELAVPAQGQASLRYRVRYHWTEDLRS